MDHFAMLTPDEQLVQFYIIYSTVKVTVFKNILSGVYGTVCRPLEILSGPRWESLVYFLMLRRREGLNSIEFIRRSVFISCTCQWYSVLPRASIRALDKRRQPFVAYSCLSIRSVQALQPFLFLLLRGGHAGHWWQLCFSKKKNT